MAYVPMPDTDGGADFQKVRWDKDGKPVCREHGAMNKVSPQFWRCVHSWSCRAGCMETNDDR